MNAVLRGGYGDHKRNEAGSVHIKTRHKSGGHLGVYRRQGVHGKADSVWNGLHGSECREAETYRAKAAGLVGVTGKKSRDEVADSQWAQEFALQKKQRLLAAGALLEAVAI